MGRSRRYIANPRTSAYTKTGHSQWRTLGRVWRIRSVQPTTRPHVKGVIRNPDSMMVGSVATENEKLARQGNNPKRRIIAADSISKGALECLAARLKYVGSANHKCRPGDYGFHPPSAPRPWKSVCDARRPLLLTEAKELLAAGVLKGMISSPDADGVPKYVWSVDAEGVPFEAKIGNGGYHGYPLYPDDDMSAVVLREWAHR